jgi:serine/threonine-protein kinase
MGAVAIPETLLSMEVDEPAVPSPVPEVDTAGLEPGGVVAHTRAYRVLSCVGEGGMGRVYRAYDPVLQRDVALKVMKPDVPAHQRRRFRQEAVFGARFCHPTMVRVYDMGGLPGGDLAWFVMEYLIGRDMHQIVNRALERGSAVRLKLVDDVFRQVLAGLQYSHDCKVVHRDVKPANMYVTWDPNTRFVTTKLLDFGVALDLDEGAEPDTELCGDPLYMAPEQAHFGAQVDGRADIYAAGMSLYEVIARRHPFEDLLEAQTSDLLEAHRERIPIPPSNFLPNDTPVELACGIDVVFEKACAKIPGDRFQTARDMHHALSSVLRS